MRNLLLSSVTLLLVPAVSFAAPDFTTHTHTDTPMELKPISQISGIKTAAVCFLGVGNCGDGGFNSGDSEYKIDTEQQCRNEGFIKLNCPNLQEIDEVCPYNSAYGKACKCSSTLTSCLSPQIGVGESCDGKYSGCSCPVGVNSENYGCKEYYSSPCNSVCKTAYSDNCHNRNSVSVPYGCAEYWSDCASKCKTAYNDNCRNRIEVSHPYGCESYYADCQAKCEIAKSKPVCGIGSFYYYDGRCESSEYANSSSLGGVIGIVVDITDDGKHGQIMALRNINIDGTLTTEYGSSYKSEMHWSTTELTDISSLPNYPSAKDASQDFNSCSNTDKITAQGNDTEYPAAWAARKFAPNLVPETKGKWCLPAAGIFTNIQNNLSAVKFAFNKMKEYGKGKDDFWRAWTSSESDNQSVWLSQTSYPVIKTHKTTSSNTFYVRPVLEF